MSDPHPRLLACEDPIADRLVEDLRGELDAPTSAQLEQHLRTCESCRARRDTWAALLRVAAAPDRALFAEHVSSADLVEYAERAHALPSTQVEAVESHLKACGSCALDLRMLRTVGSSPARARRLRAPRGGWLLAYAAVLTMLVPTAALVGRWSAGRGDAPVARPVPSAQYLESTVRGEGEPWIVVPESGEATVVFRVPVLESGAARYEVRLRDERDRTVWTSGDLAPEDDFGTFRLLLRGARLGPGSYRLRVDEIDARSGELRETFDFPFRVRR